jgi:hypothetical protein
MYRALSDRTSKATPLENLESRNIHRWDSEADNEIRR